MTGFTTFNSLAGTGEVDQPAQALDTNFSLVSTVFLCDASGASPNLTLTPTANQPPFPTPIQDKTQFSFTANANYSGAITVTIGGNTYSSSLPSLTSGQSYNIQFIQALFSGAGGFQFSTTNAATQPTGDNSTKVATTAFVQNQAAAMIAASVGTTYGSVGSYANVNAVGGASPSWTVGPSLGNTDTVVGLSGTWRNMGSFGASFLALRVS